MRSAPSRTTDKISISVRPSPNMAIVGYGRANEEGEGPSKSAVHEKKYEPVKTPELPI